MSILSVPCEALPTVTRTNNLDMPGFMRALTDSQREAIAHYLAGL